MHAVRYSQIGLQKHSHGKTWIGGAVKPVNLAGVVWRNMEVGWKVTWSLGKHRWQPRRKPGQAPGVYCQPPYNAARRACVSLAVVVANRPLSSHTLRGLRPPPSLQLAGPFFFPFCCCTAQFIRLLSFRCTGVKGARMVFSSGNFTLLLQTMGLVQGIRRPTPSHSTSTPPAKGAKAPVSWVHSQFAGTDSQSPGQDLPSVHINSQSGDCSVQPYEGPDLSALAFAPFERSKATVFRYRQQQSVNLGSW